MSLHLVTGAVQLASDCLGRQPLKRRPPVGRCQIKVSRLSVNWAFCRLLESRLTVSCIGLSRGQSLSCPSTCLSFSEGPTGCQVLLNIQQPGGWCSPPTRALGVTRPSPALLAVTFRRQGCPRRQQRAGAPGRDLGTELAIDENKQVSQIHFKLLPFGGLDVHKLSAI